MDCPICFETITKETGQVTTSCGHSFHFKCLNTWYWRQTQNEEGQESCPCCRKMPGEFERASTVTGSEESESISEWTVDQENSNEWVQVGPRRWIIPSSEPERLQILAQVASEQDKIDELYIPPYNPENHALWVLRNFFELPTGDLVRQEEITQFDRPKIMRRRQRPLCRTFWSHLGTEYELNRMDGGYKTD
jgi:hypothetical protein